MHFLFLLALVPFAAAHGYLSSPPPRGIEKETSDVDALKSPNTAGLCRGEPQGKITQATPGGQLTLGFTITAPHTGPCEVYILDENLQNPVKIADKYDCAAPGKAGPWTITLPTDLSGRKVLRWYWEGRHRTPGEPYEQCIDLDFGGGDDSQPSSSYGSDSSNTLPPSSSPDDGNSQPPSDGSDGSNAPSSNDDSDSSNTSPPSSGPDDDNSQSSGDGSGDGHDSQPPTNLAQTNAINPPTYGAQPLASSQEPGECDAGSFQCSDSQSFKQCVNGQWSVVMQCGVGTQCRQTGPTIQCGY